jgi:hypothetical protein
VRQSRLNGAVDDGNRLVETICSFGVRHRGHDFTQPNVTVLRVTPESTRFFGESVQHGRSVRDSRAA